MNAGKFKVTTPPALEPVTLEEAKEHLRVDGTDADLMINSLIRAGRDYVETHTRRALITRTLDVYFDRFIFCLAVPRPPLQGVSAVTYTDPDGAEQTVPSADYAVDLVSDPGQIYPALNAAWPSAASVPNAVKVTCTAGYGSAPADVPEPLRQAVLFHAQAHYDNDPKTFETLMQTCSNLIASYAVNYV